MYSVMKCMMKSGFLSFLKNFFTHTGIKQGAPYSVILFLIFMDDCIVKMLEKCIDEVVIANLHVLLHADDTVMIRTNRELFVSKCNMLVETFKEKRMSLNIGISGFIVINPSKADDRTVMKLECGWLTYGEEYLYLGTIFSDKGIVNADANLHACKEQK